MPISLSEECWLFVGFFCVWLISITFFFAFVLSISSVCDASGETQCIDSQYYNYGYDNRGSPGQRVSRLLYWLTNGVLGARKTSKNTHIKGGSQLTDSLSLQGGEAVQPDRASREDVSHRVYSSSSRWSGVHKRVASSLFMPSKERRFE